MAVCEHQPCATWVLVTPRPGLSLARSPWALAPQGRWKATLRPAAPTSPRPGPRGTAATLGPPHGDPQGKVSPAPGQGTLQPASLVKMRHQTTSTQGQPTPGHTRSTDAALRDCRAQPCPRQSPTETQGPKATARAIPLLLLHNPRHSPGGRTGCPSPPTRGGHCQLPSGCFFLFLTMKLLKCKCQ